MPADEALALRRRAGLDRSFDTMLAAASPELGIRLGDARRTSAVRGAVRSPNHIRQATGPGWALVGDAGYHRDPVTGHGISDAFRNADLLVEAADAALRSDDREAEALARYQ